VRNALDFETPPAPAELARQGLDALVYTGNARPSLEWVTEARSLGVTVTFIQETVSTRSQGQHGFGIVDCQFAERRAKELGHTGSIAVVVSDGSWVDAWDCSAYGAEWQSVATLPFFSYGSVGCCESFNRGAPRSLGTWIPATWGAGTLMTQIVGPSPIAGTDLNIVHADYTGTGATPAPADIIGDEDTMLIINQDTGEAAIIFANHQPRKIASVNSYQRGTFVTLPGDAWKQYWDDAIKLYTASITVPTAGGGGAPVVTGYTGTLELKAS